MLAPETFARMAPEQRKWLSQQGNRARELLRLAQEPPEEFQRFAIVGRGVTR